MAMRNPYTKEEDAHLVAYIATECPGLSGRQGNKPYQKLTDNPKEYPWAKGHSWQGWRERYKANKAYFDHKIAKYQERQGIDASVEETRSSQRIAFTDDDDKYLAKYLAWYCRQKKGRSGNAPYKKLVENAERKWPWSARHPYQGWRARYLDHQEYFDLRIAAYQRKHNIPVDVANTSPKRAANGAQSERAAKRRKIVDTYDSEEERWSRIGWPSPAKNAALSKVAGPSKVVEVKVEAKQEVRADPVASTSKAQVNGNGRVHRGEDDAGVDDDDDDDDDNLIPVGSEDYRGEIFQDRTQGHVDEMPGIEEDVVGEAEVHADDPSSPLDEHLNADLEKELKEAEELAEIWEPEEVPPVDNGPSSSLSPPKPTQPKHGTLSRNNFTLVSQSRRHLDDDPFEDVTSPPHHTRNPPPRKTKRPPAIIEGAFGNKFETGTKKKARESSVEDSSDDKETSATWLPSPRPRTKEVERAGTGSMWPPARGKKGHVEGVNGAITMVELEPRAVEQRRREKGKQKAVEPDVFAEAPVNGHHPPAPLPMKPSQLLRSNVINISDASSNWRSNAPRRATDIFAPPAPLPETMGVKSPKRHSTGTMKSSNARTINFRQEIANRQLLSQQQRPSLPRRSSSRTSHVSSSFIPDQDENQRISRQQEFVSQCLMMFSEQFGFSVDVVLKTWEKLQDVGKMVEVLTRVKESAERTMDELMEGVLDGSSMFEGKGENMLRSSEIGLGSSKRANTTDALDMNSSQHSSPFSVVNPEQSGSSAIKERRQSSVGGSGGKGRKSLEIRLVDPEPASADSMHLYHPLAGTRAGNFDRLVKMGREEEALEREQRRVSSVALSPLRNTPQELQSQGKPADQILGDNDDDVYEEEEIPIQGEDSDVDEEDVEKMDVLPDVEDKDVEMGEASFEVEGRMIKVEPLDTSQLQLNELKRRPCEDNVGDERSELDNDASPIKADKRESVEQEMKSELAEMVHDDGVKSRSAETVEGVVVVGNDEVERWEEFEGLFWAANRSNVERLKEIEKEFSMEFLMGWLTSEVTI